MLREVTVGAPYRDMSTRDRPESSTPSTDAAKRAEKTGIDPHGEAEARTAQDRQRGLAAMAGGDVPPAVLGVLDLARDRNHEFPDGK